MPSTHPASHHEMSPHRAAARAGDLVLGGVLALVLLIACIAWEAMSGTAAPHALSGEPEINAPARGAR